METIGQVHLIPTVGMKPLDAITTEVVQQLKHQLMDRAPKTVNNVLTVLYVLLKKAVEWDVIEQLTVARSEWKSHVTTPKGGRIRYVPMTRRLTVALREARGRELNDCDSWLANRSALTD